MRQQSSADFRANMIEIIVLFLGVFGALAAPGIPDTPETLYATRNIVDDTEVFLAPPLRGSENLDEKAMPLSKLVTPQQLLPGGQDLVEKSQGPSQELPGTRNLAEKRIPEPILRKFYQPEDNDQRNL